MTEEERARFDALTKIRDFWHARWISRRDFAWKVTLASWALLAAMPLYMKQRPPEAVLASALAIYVIVFTFSWVRIIHDRDRKDSRMALHFNSHAERMLFPDADILAKPRDPRWFGFATDTLAVFQIVATALLAIVAYWLIGDNVVTGVTQR